MDKMHESRLIMAYLPNLQKWKITNCCTKDRISRGYDKWSNLSIEERLDILAYMDNIAQEG